MKKKHDKQKQGGIALFYTILVIGFLAAMSSSITIIAYRQASLSAYSDASLTAFYASESGLECGLYWDVVENAFRPVDGGGVPITSKNITCNGQTTNVNPSTGVSPVSFTYANGSIAEVTIDKRDPTHPTIQAKGYNTADPASTRRVERGLNLTYEQNISSGTTEVNDIMLILDVSGSVCNDTFTNCQNFKDLKKAAKTIVDNLTIASDKTKIGVVSFQTSAILELPLSDNKGSIISTINGLPIPGGGTNLSGGLKKAEIELQTNNRAGANPFVILITDGWPTYCSDVNGDFLSCSAAGTTASGQAISVSNSLKSQGVGVAAVGVFVNASVKAVGEPYLKDNIVSDPSSTFYLDVSDWDVLEAKVGSTFTQDFFKSTRAGFSRQEL